MKKYLPCFFVCLLSVGVLPSFAADVSDEDTQKVSEANLTPDQQALWDDMVQQIVTDVESRMPIIEAEMNQFLESTEPNSRAISLFEFMFRTANAVMARDESKEMEFICHVISVASTEEEEQVDGDMAIALVAGGKFRGVFISSWLSSFNETTQARTHWTFLSEDKDAKKHVDVSLFELIWDPTLKQWEPVWDTDRFNELSAVQVNPEGGEIETLELNAKSTPLTIEAVEWNGRAVRK